jgi:hypothetical protein
MSFETPPHPPSRLAADETREALLHRLLNLRVTRYEYGFLHGLLGHNNPSPPQLKTLARIEEKYSNIWNQNTQHYDHNNNGNA